MNQPSMPWWRVPTMWLVVGGPATVVVAGVVTAVIAVHGADPPATAKPVPAVAATAPLAPIALMPAMQGRNRAAEQALP